MATSYGTPWSGSSSSIGDLELQSVLGQCDEGPRRVSSLVSDGGAAWVAGRSGEALSASGVAGGVVEVQIKLATEIGEDKFGRKR